MWSFLNNPATVWVLIPIAAIGFGMFRPLIAVWTKQAEARGSDEGSDNRHERRIQYLEQRMQVLERIVTDRGLDIAAEIDRLRDDRSHLDERLPRSDRVRLGD